MPGISLEKRVSDAFHYFHENPELSYQEFGTTRRIREELAAGGIAVLPLPLETGCVAEVGSGERLIALRCDIDALPVQEETDLPYKSRRPGVMHACGHDFHAALMIGAAHLLKAREKELRGRVRIVFQPAEEAPGGARKIIESGALSGAEAIFGVHTIINLEPGTLALREGATHAAVDRFSITLTGRGTHAAHPELGIDVTLAASQLVVAAQSVVSRNSSPFDANLLSVTRFSSGSTWNVIPESAFLEGTVRTMTPETRELVKRRLEEIARGIAETFGAKAEVRWVTGLPPMQNDPELTGWVRELALKEGFRVVRSPASLGGEDFSLYEEHLPGAFIQIGTGPSLPNHNPRFVADERALFPAAKFLARVAEERLKTTNR